MDHIRIKRRDHDHWQAQVGSILLGSSLVAPRFKDAEIRSLEQVHSADLVNDHQWQVGLRVGDGLITEKGNVLISVRTADCVPLLIVMRERIAVVHAGWRGVAAGIVERLAVSLALEKAHVVMGPSIYCRNYEVDKDLYGSWLKRDPGLSPFLKPAPAGGSKRLFDLRGLVCNQLFQLGLPKNRLTLVRNCTFEGPWPSYRRDGLKAGRLISYIIRNPQCEEHS